MEADVRDEVVEAFLPIQGGPHHGECQVAGVFDAKRRRAADIGDGGTWDGPEAGGVGPLGAPPV